MNNLRLDENQIKYLIDYTEKHNIVYKDVQLELVDHLASAVEDIMSKDKEINFNRALYDFTVTLPVDFYYRFIEDKTKTLTSLWRKKFTKYFLGFFTIPRCFITVLLYLTFYKTFFILTNDNFLKLYAIVLFVMIFTMFRYRDYKLRNIKNYLVVETYKSGSIILEVIFFSIPVFIGSQTFTTLMQSKTGIIFIAAGMTSMVLYTYASSFVFLKMLKEDLNKKYAHLNISLS